MPLYEYQCKKCGSVFEVLQRSSDPSLELHDRCGGRLEKLLSPPAFQFKGSGWYITDYAKSSSKAAAAADKETKPAAAETKTEAPKPAATGNK